MREEATGMLRRRQQRCCQEEGRTASAAAGSNTAAAGASSSSSMASTGQLYREGGSSSFFRLKSVSECSGALNGLRARRRGGRKLEFFFCTSVSCSHHMHPCSIVCECVWKGGAKLFPPFFPPLLNRLLLLKLLLLQLMLLLQRHRALRDRGSYIEEEENNSQKWQQCPSAVVGPVVP